MGDLIAGLVYLDGCLGGIMSTKKQIWLDIETGKFSYSWDVNSVDLDDMTNLSLPEKSTIKLIEYECKNDNDFQFTPMMVIK